MNLHLYDFDGTLTKKDSMIEFLRSIHSRKTFVLRLIMNIPFYFLYKFKIINREKFKIFFLKIFLKDKTHDELKFHSEDFAREFVDKMSPNVIEHLNKNKNIAIQCLVTASLDIWMAPIANLLGLHLISTNSKFDEDGKFIGLNGKNCNFSEKVKRVNQKFDLDSFDNTIVYGDSAGDKEMMKIADKRQWDFFKNYL